MIKWVLLAVGCLIATIFVVLLIKYMLKTEKETKQQETAKKTESVQEEYQPQNAPTDIHSASGGVPLTDMSVKPSDNNDLEDTLDFPMPPSGFMDDADSDFADFSDFAHKSKGRRRKSVDFDLEGDLADEYIPDSPEFSYLPKRQPQKRKPLSTELNELPTELKVLMLSDIFDRKFD
jgi:hypothetical protein